MRSNEKMSNMGKLNYLNDTAILDNHISKIFENMPTIPCLLYVYVDVPLIDLHELKYKKYAE